MMTNKMIKLITELTETFPNLAHPIPLPGRCLDRDWRADPAVFPWKWELEQAVMAPMPGFSSPPKHPAGFHPDGRIPKSLK